VFENALPVLSDLGFTSTNYFVANQFDGGNVWDREKKIPFSPLMSRTEVRAWAAAGQEVGSHTLDHVHLPEVSHDEARRQIRLSREILAQESGAEVTAFCYPYGDFTLEHGLLAKEAGYTTATTTNRGLANAADDPFFLPRVGIWRTTHMLRFLQKCLTRHEDRRRS
jgi:peptidoglycan/xylan/chitin deacetylase (PgdA/CDA1 family)